MRDHDRINLILLWKRENGMSVEDIAAEHGYRLSWTYECIANAKDYREHLYQTGLSRDDTQWINVIVTGVVHRCKHGLPGLEDGTWLCEECMTTNNPEHPAFHREPPKRYEESEEAAKEAQPKGTPKFKPKIKTKKAKK